MSQDSLSSAGSATPATSPVTESKADDQPERVFLVSYPKIMFLYPTAFVSLFCGIVMWFKGGLPIEPAKVASSGAEPVQVMRASLSGDVGQASAAGESPIETPADPAGVPADSTAPAAVSGPIFHVVCARIFLFVLTINLVVIAFDFPRTTSLTWFFALVAVSIGLWFLFHTFPQLAPGIMHTLGTIRPAANTAFYLIFFCAILFLFICVLISRRFDYWEVKGNELLHHHGFLSNLERFSAPNLRIDKEINDLFEYMLLRSGRLIIHASNERRAIVLENVLFINEKEERITRMLGALQVRVRTEPS